MGLGAVGRSAGAATAAPSCDTPTDVVWHDMECGCYRADLTLWHELAGQGSGAILDVGAGTGRVTLELARAGLDVTALDLSPELLTALRNRSEGAVIQTLCADARSFTLARRDYALCIVPMQTIQLLGGRDGRLAFLRRAHAHLRPGGILACAIISGLEPFDCANGDLGPSAESASLGDVLYTSRATRVAETSRGVLIERERRIVAAGSGAADTPAPPPAIERNLIELDNVVASGLELEAIEAGFTAEPAREIAPTADHVGSVVVMLRA
jgi:SAM-dependent methyltransferase